MLVFAIFLSSLTVQVSLSVNSSKPLKVADYLISKCNVDPYVNFPGESTGEPAKVTISFTPMRFIGIVDVEEEFSIAASISLSWSDQCTINALESEDFKNQNYSTFYFEKDTFWSPKMIHVNSKVFKATKSDDFERGIRLYRSPGYAFYISYIYGVFNSHCDLDLKTFPFDK